ncbi:MAG: RNA-binding domain-containing protein [Candidatus Bathyarchaeia archaeon]|nr:exosome protein [Candidatus Bathyarchaeota archaeon]
MKKKISYVDLSFFAHATEDSDKVLTAAKNILPSNYVENVSFSKSNLKGEYGNPIILYRAQIREPEAADSLLHNISLNLPLIDKEELNRYLNLYVDEGSLYIRLSKQEAFKGRLKFSQADPIRIRIRFRSSKIEEIREICRTIGLLP